MAHGIHPDTAARSFKRPSWKETGDTFISRVALFIATIILKNSIRQRDILFRRLLF